MALRLRDHWIWDHWILTGDDHLDLFFLRASRALHDPFRRHFRASIGHAVSHDDGATWQLLPDALVHADAPAFDDRACWTGSAIRHPDGFIRLFYTGISHGDGGRLVQRIGWADSRDGVTFTRMSRPPLEADPRWYAVPGDADVNWRDPFVFRHEGRWHMVITASAAGAPPGYGGVIGHAVSDDLETWQVREPLTEPSRFRHLECSQVRRIDGTDYLVFSCGATMLVDPSQGSVWVAKGESPLGPFDLAGARYVSPDHLYAGQLFQDTSAQWWFTGFDSVDDTNFPGVVADPIAWRDLELRTPA
ncbi:glycosyl hydrolase family 32 [Nanchangia anserum]|uniref:Glycosyl hydrolase family 32 n=1 Tax=Nanchangia anserum TaxID=2692125 RepID=A0A8I0GE11_9ACTO|nr:glycosyl hydrolase family 32 [Nanchangia anserum]MBD3689142.1 glycosyl hydrolase family 32 [Nanchangia anserum]QOX81375.1 glycosyl hydrolase family 32 [Nanchangia anserum]